MAAFISQENRPPTRDSALRVCKVCGDGIELRDDGTSFTTCYECEYPVCKPCYDYEWTEGTQCCPQCHTQYKHHKGSPTVDGGDEEDNFDANNFDYEFLTKNSPDTQHHAAHQSGSDVFVHFSYSEIPI